MPRRLFWGPAHLPTCRKEVRRVGQARIAPPAGRDSQGSAQACLGGALEKSVHAGPKGGLRKKHGCPACTQKTFRK